MRIIVIVCMLLACLGLAVSASQVNTYDIQGNLVHVTYEFESKAGNFTLILPKDAESISLELEDAPVLFDQFRSDDLKINTSLVISGKLKVSYITSDFIENPSSTYFVVDVKSFDYGTTTVRVILPKGSSLAKPLKDNSGSIHPTPNSILSDGERISFEWIYDSKPSTSFPILIEYNSENIILPILVLFIGLLLSAIVYFIIHRAKKDVQIYHNEPQKQNPEITPKSTSFHLKEDEKAVVRALKLKEGSTTQSTLVIATGFSKATLSRLLMELEERNIVKKVKKGNKNLIILKEDIWNDLEQL